MRAYVFRRMLLLPVTVLLLSIFVFGLIRLVPGSVIDARLSAGFPAPPTPTTAPSWKRISGSISRCISNT